MSTDGNKAIIHRLTEAWNQGNVQLLDDILASDFRHHASLQPNGSRVEYVQWFQDTRTAFPDLLLTIDNLVAEGDQVAGHWTFQGTHQAVLNGPTGPIPPTGKRVTVSGMTLFRCAAGQLVEDWHAGDDLGFMQQLGLIPKGEPTGAAASDSRRMDDAQGQGVMTAEDNKARSHRFFEEVWNRGNMSVLDELMAPEFVDHDPGVPGLPAGREGVGQWVTMVREAFPDVHFTIDDQIAEGDHVVTRWTARGTQRGAFMGIPASGKQVAVTGITLARYANGQNTENWVSWDKLGMLQQLGALPLQEQTARR